MDSENRAEIVIFDIDGTLADISARQHHLLKSPKDWDAFFQGLAKDKPIAPMLRLCNTLYEAGFEILVCSGRPEKYRQETKAWLANYGVKYHDLLLRPNNDRRSDVVIKREMLDKIDRSRIVLLSRIEAGLLICGGLKALFAFNVLQANFESLFYGSTVFS